MAFLTNAILVSTGARDFHERVAKLGIDSDHRLIGALGDFRRLPALGVG